jgi:hypothetical protein
MKIPGKFSWLASFVSSFIVYLPVSFQNNVKVKEHPLPGDIVLKYPDQILPWHGSG